jgi:hypothetical protein
VHNYHGTHNLFPREMVTNPGWGWGALILPYIEQTALHQQINPGQVAFPAATVLFGGARALQTPVKAFRCPADSGPVTNAFYSNPNNATDNNGYATSNYICNQQVIPHVSMDSLRMANVTDGTTNVFLIGERRLQIGATLQQRHTGAIFIGIGRGSDSQLTFHATTPINTASFNSTSLTDASAGDTARRLRFAITSAHAGGALFSLTDGSVRFVNQNIATNPAAIAASNATNGSDLTGPGFIYQNLLTRDDGFPLGDF